jgi:hypothetical protein
MPDLSTRIGPPQNADDTCFGDLVGFTGVLTTLVSFLELDVYAGLLLSLQQ